MKKNTKIFSNLWLEYSRVSNRTYQTQGTFGQENYLHRGFSIGHYLGNDFDQLSFSADFLSKNIYKYNVEPKLKLSYIRDGSEGIETKWNSPWEEYNSVSNGKYEEKFPSEPIQYIAETRFSLKFFLWKESYFDLGLFTQHIIKQNKKQFNKAVYIEYWLAFDKIFRY